MSENAKKLYTHMSSLVSNSQNPDTSQYTQDMEELRKTYLSIFDDQEKNHKDDLLWWKNQFINISNKLSEEYTLMSNSTTDKYEKIVVGYNNELHEFGTDKKIILIGRMYGCDILFKNNLYISRLCGIIMILSGIRKILVIDVGSSHGIMTYNRSSNKEKQHSLKGERKVLLFDLDESFCLKFGDVMLSISPKECIICFQRPRSCVLSCGHYICCDECLDKIKECSICRANKGEVKKNMIEFKTNIYNQ